MDIRRTFLLGVIGALTLAAGLGIWVLLFEHFFGIEWQVFATLGSVVLFCLPALAVASMMERGHWRRAMAGVMGLCVLGLGFYQVVIWGYELLFRALDDDWVFKLMAVVGVWAVAIPWIAMLAIGRFRRGGGRVVQWLSMAAAAGLAGLLTLLIATEFDLFDDDLAWRLVGMLGILTALGTLTVPILLRVQGIDRVAGVESTALELAVICPRCMHQQVLPTGPSRCACCRLRFRIEIQEPRCPRCDYLLHKLTRPVCPECGLTLDRSELPVDPGSVAAEAGDGSAGG